MPSISTKSVSPLSLDGAILATVRDVANHCTYPPGHILVTQGRMEHTFFVIDSGQLEVVRQMEDGEQRVINVLGPDQYFGELALLDDSPRFATVRALSEVSVFELDQERFQALMDLNPTLVVRMIQGVLSSLRMLDRRTIDDLNKKNKLLERAYSELQQAQAQLVEKERLERELELAADVQRSLLPASLPQLPDYSFAAYLAPARIVGGDLYDISIIDDEHVAIMMADVADKGMQAALIMAVTRTLFYQAAQRSLSPAEVALTVHRGLLDLTGSHDNRYGDVFVTAFYGVLHCPSGRLTYVRAAHERPLLQAGDNSPNPLPGGGRFLGMLEDLSLTEEEIVLEPGDSLLLFSDGVPDAHNSAEESYGYDRLIEALYAARHMDPAGQLAQVKMDVETWMGDEAPFDDMSMMALQAHDRP